VEKDIQGQLAQPLRSRNARPQKANANQFEIVWPHGADSEVCDRLMRQPGLEQIRELLWMEPRILTVGTISFHTHESIL